MSDAQQAGQNQYLGRIAAAAMGLTLGFGGTTLLLPATETPAHGVNRLVSETPLASPGASAAVDNIDYASCSAVRVAGAAPIRRGQPGYARHLDADGDGVGCE
jgi:hypothetical protein